MVPPNPPGVKFSSPLVATLFEEALWRVLLEEHKWQKPQILDLFKQMRRRQALLAKGG